LDPEVPFAAATTGSTNLLASVLCPDPSALYTYLTTKVATLPSVQQMETAPVLQTLAGRLNALMQGHLNLEVICRSDQSLTGPVTRPLLGARVLLA
jgi:hypothetical protein